MEALAIPEKEDVEKEMEEEEEEGMPRRVKEGILGKEEREQVTLLLLWAFVLGFRCSSTKFRCCCCWAAGCRRNREVPARPQLLLLAPLRSRSMVLPATICDDCGVVGNERVTCPWGHHVRS